VRGRLIALSWALLGLAVAACATAPPPPAPKPPLTPASFGMVMAAELSERPSCAPRGAEGVFVCDALAVPYPGLESLAGHYHRNTGICAVTLVGRVIDHDPYGYKVRRAFDTLVDDLVAVYGADAEGTDRLAADASLTDERQWLQAVAAGQRDYNMAWHAGSGFAGRDGVTGIYAEISGIDATHGRVVLFFAFENYDHCKDEIARDKAGRS